MKFPTEKSRGRGNTGCLGLLGLGIFCLVAAVFFNNLLSCNGSRYTPLPSIPINISQRNSFSGATKVVRVTNTGKITLSLVIQIESRTFNKRKNFLSTLAPGGSGEVGWAEGWEGAPGEIVTVSSDGYRDSTYVLKE